MTNNATGRVRLTGLWLALMLTAMPAAAQDLLLQLNDELTTVAQRVLPSVVKITNTLADEGGPPSLEIPGRPPQGPMSRGSGMLFRETPEYYYILTNAHVVRNARGNEVKVKLVAEVEERTGTVLGADPRNDTAVVRMPRRAGENLQLVSFGSVERLKIGEFVMAIGSPFDFEASVSLGVVSSLDRELREPPIDRASPNNEVYRGLIQTSAPINPGNSGGPLVNMRGEVVGITFAIYSPGPTAGNIGIGFAIPIDRSLRWVDDIIERGYPRRGYLGVNIEDVSDWAVGQGIPLDQVRELLGTAEGAYVVEVRPDTPAAAAGLRPGDIIVGFNGRSVASVGELQDVVSQTAPDTPSAVEILRDGERQTVQVSLAEMSRELMGMEPGNPGTAPQRMARDPLGLSVEALTAERARELGIEATGVVVTAVEPGSVAQERGLVPGAVLLEGRRPGQQRVAFNSVAAYREFIEAAQGQTVQLWLNVPAEDEQRRRISIPVMVPGATER